AMQARAGWEDSMSRRGLTLVELVLWMALVALTASIGYGLVAPFGEQRKFEAGLDRVVTALEFARDTARYTGRDIEVRLAPRTALVDPNTVTLRWVDTDSVLLQPQTDRRYIIAFDTDTSLQGMKIESCVSGLDDRMRFDSGGQPVDTNGWALLSLKDR